MVGPGKYDDVCTLVREQTNAACAIVVIIEGDKGSGFSVQTTADVNGNTIALLLENMAQQLRDE